MDSASRRVIEHAPLVLVDFDGTLATLQTDWAGLKMTLSERCRSQKWPWNPAQGLDANLRSIRTLHGEAAFNRLCKDVAMAEISGFDAEAVSHDLIQVLRDRGTDPTAIVTNNTRVGVNTILQHEVFDGIRPRVIGKEDVSESKPSPRGLTRACRLFVASSKATVFIGDADSDERASRLAGIGIFIRATPPVSGRLRLAA
ncbi:MAG: phosphoglycolate phosphatase-like HAD superfamily hydrolase [Rhodothermales bacterium]|jgi:phosphoglycolate phosphatase-like HAD superfamily hydrolase